MANKAGKPTLGDKSGRYVGYIDFWSDPQEEISLSTVAADTSLPSVTIGDFPDESMTVLRVVAMFKFRMIENSSSAGANKLDGAQNIQVRDDAPGTWRDAINFVDDLFTIAAETREGGDVIIGDTDISVEITDLDNTYEFQWDEAVVDRDNLIFNDLQTGLRVYFTLE